MTEIPRGQDKSACGAGENDLRVPQVRDDALMGAVTQFRLKRGAQLDNHMYAPNRDLARIGPAALRVAMENLSHEFPWLREAKDRLGVSDEDLVEGAKRLARFVSMVAMPEAGWARESWIASGLGDLSNGVLLLLFSQIGRVFLPAVYNAMMELSRDPTFQPRTVDELLDGAVEILGW